MCGTPAAVVNPSHSKSDYFALFGLTRAYTIARDDLEARYLRLAAEAHPDRVVAASDADQRAAMERAAMINEAYRVLRDPVLRAEYLVRLAGIDLDSSDGSAGAPSMDQAFLLDMIERREALEEARASGLKALEAFRGGVEVEHDDALDDAVAALEREEIGDAARALVARRYFARLLEEIDAEAA